MFSFCRSFALIVVLPCWCSCGREGGGGRGRRGVVAVDVVVVVTVVLVLTVFSVVFSPSGRERLGPRR